MLTRQVSLVSHLKRTSEKNFDFLLQITHSTWTKQFRIRLNDLTLNALPKLHKKWQHNKKENCARGNFLKYTSVYIP